VITYKSIRQVTDQAKNLIFLGKFALDEPKNKHGRYQKKQPPKHLGDSQTQKEADFIIIGHADGPIVVECKNVREWLYPNSSLIKELIVKSYELGGQPLMIHRRIHYSAISNLLMPAGIMAHESLFQYYPADQIEIAQAVAHKRSLGFTDIRASEVPEQRTQNFFSEILPQIAPKMAARWDQNKENLYRFAKAEINIAQLYTAIGSPAGGKWVEQENDPPDQEDYPGYD
jgi:hypothetical protein